MEEATRLGCADFDKIEFLASLRSIRNQTLKESTITSAFQACGLIPCNPDVVLSKLQETESHGAVDATASFDLRLPSRIDDNLWSSGAEAVANVDVSFFRIGKTPELEGETTVTPKTPTTVRSLKQLRDEILLELDLLAIPKRKKVLTFLKGLLVQAVAGDLALRHMRNTTAAQKARDNRVKAGMNYPFPVLGVCQCMLTNKGKQQLQSGGILYAGTARAMIKDREKEELRKAQVVLDRAAAKEEPERTRVEKERVKEEKERVRMEKQEEKQREKEKKQCEREEKAILMRYKRVCTVVRKRRAGVDQWMDWVERKNNTVCSPCFHWIQFALY